MFIIPANTGIQDNTGFRVKPGMTNYTKLMSSCLIGLAGFPATQV